MKNYGIKTYKKNEVCSFRYTKDKFGGFSNMCGGYWLNVNNIHILSSEALYQSIKFTNHPDIQKNILTKKSPIDAKKVAIENKNLIREDWMDIRVDVMYWCLKVKLCQNFEKFGLLLQESKNLDIVEHSYRDNFWGAMDDGEYLIGQNILGRLLMNLRKRYNENKNDLVIVEPLEIENFLLLWKNIETITINK